jgi:hypothetical protein
MIPTRCASVEVASFRTTEDQGRENTGDYHNPTRQRAIFPNTSQNAKAQSLTDAAGWDGGQRTTLKRVSERFFPILRKTQKGNPSLTQRVGMAAKLQLQNSRVGLG